MKKFIILIAVVAAIAAAMYIGENRPGPEIEPVYYFRSLIVPDWMPVSRGFMPGTMENPIYELYRQDRHLIIIVSVPARRLFNPVDSAEPDLDSSANNVFNPDDVRYYPRFKLTTRKGEQWPPRGVVPWPKTKDITNPSKFADDQNWYPHPQENPNKRFYLALYFRMAEKNAVGPFELFIDDEPPITIEQKYHIYPDW